MPEPEWPSSAEVHEPVRERLAALLESTGGLVAELGRQTMSAKQGILSDAPHSAITILPAGTCMAACGDWEPAIWPAVAAECMMAAADLFDDAADADPEGAATIAAPAVLLTVGAGLLSLAGAAAARVVEDGATAETVAALAAILGEGFASAANGQAANLQAGTGQVDPLTAYRQAAAKSGPLGSVMARLGARVATDDPDIVDLLGEFGMRLTLRSQLLNDLRDAAPDAAVLKADVRAGARTVPLAFTGSRGAPSDLSGTKLAEWERAERERVAAHGGLAAAAALAEAERLSAIEVLDRLESLGCPVLGLRQLL
jgi:geranylgeranyl pyrophosphate synthase